MALHLFLFAFLVAISVPARSEDVDLHVIKYSFLPITKIKNSECIYLHVLPQLLDVFFPSAQSGTVTEDLQYQVLFLGKASDIRRQPENSENDAH